VRHIGSTSVPTSSKRERRRGPHEVLYRLASQSRHTKALSLSQECSTRSALKLKKNMTENIAHDSTDFEITCLIPCVCCADWLDWPCTKSYMSWLLRQSVVGSSASIAHTLEVQAWTFPCGLAHSSMAPSFIQTDERSLLQLGHPRNCSKVLRRGLTPLLERCKTQLVLLVV